MKGKLYRRNKDGYIYEVIGQDDRPGREDSWILWNERAGERHYVMGIELQRQVGWELVGVAQGIVREQPAEQQRPAALMK